MVFALTRFNEKEQWDCFVKSSPQGNVFCLTPFLDALGEDYALVLVEENSVPVLGAVIIKRDGQPVCAPYPFTMYQGVLFDQAVYELPPHSRVKHALEIVDFLLSELEKRFTRISFCLHPRFEDLRSFMWFHYHEPEKGQFKVELRYTGILELTVLPDFDQYLTAIRTVRRYEYRRTRSKGFVIESSDDVETLDRLHRLTFERQGTERSSKEQKLVWAISEAALGKGFGELLLARDGQGNVAAATLFLHDNRCGYYLFGANDPEYRNSGSGTLLILENIRRCKEKGLKTVDFVGINSPNRGDFKTSFNAVPKPYFVVTWESPSAYLAEKS